MANRGKTVELDRWTDALADYIVTLRKAQGLKTNIQKKEFVENLIMAYAKAMATTVAEPEVRANLIALINAAEK